MRFRASEAAAAIGAALVGPDVTIHGVAFDSRMLQPGQLFVALRGKRDGHEFLADAVERGAAAVLAQRPAASATSIVVAGNTLRSLMDLAAAMRRRFAGTVVGITGSVGKTSTKDLCWAAVGASRRTAANAKSFNNEQGLPTTVLNAADDTEVLVLEMGMRAAGEITELCAIARPMVGVVIRRRKELQNVSDRL
jgi:UDP-N-acetylmuramoyl-tripeptide--D-alanyl-D-alanine ligase